MLRVPNPWPLVAAVFLSLGLLMPAAAHADDSLTYSPSPAYLGSSEQFSACGFQQGETADLVMDNANVSQGTAENDGCVHISQQTPLDIDPTTHSMSIKGESSGKEQIGVFGLSLPAQLPAGSSTEPFDIQATDGQRADFDGSNQFLMVPPGYAGHTHVVLNKA